MSKVVTAFPSTVGRPEKYPYAVWFDGQMHELVKGEDFTTSIESMRGALAQAKARKNVNLRTALNAEGNLVIQVIPASKPAPAKKAAAPAAKKAKAKPAKKPVTPTAAQKAKAAEAAK